VELAMDGLALGFAQMAKIGGVYVVEPIFTAGAG